MKPQYSIISFVLICILLLSGCAHGHDSLIPYSLSKDTAVTLWVVTEPTFSDGMNHEARLRIEEYQAHYPQVQIKLEILPSAEPERSSRIREIQEQMAVGSGPDIFLLPTSDVLTLEYPQQYTYTKITPFFQDVPAAMEGGQFLDISSYYDADASLGQEALQQEVMEAGTLGSARYVLPLRYTTSVLCVFPELLEGMQLETAILENGIDDWMAYILETGDSTLACGAELSGLNAFSDWNDCDLETYLLHFQSIQTMIGTQVEHRSRAMIFRWLSGSWKPFPIQIVNLEFLMDYIAIAQAEALSLSIYPVPSDQGDHIANITYYTAISSDCSNPDYAYEFCRMFLLEDSQWERSRLQPAQAQYMDLMEQGWPVRTKGSVAALWENYRQQTGTPYADITLEDSMLPILSEEMNIVRFPDTNLSRSFDELLASLNDFSNGNAPTTADIPLLAEEFRKILEEN